VKVVFIFSSKTSILVWCGLKQAENGPKTTHVSDLRLSLCENHRFQKRSYSACFQAENDLYINSGTGVMELTRHNRRCKRHLQYFIAGVNYTNYTGEELMVSLTLLEHKIVNISANFRKNLKRPLWET
jgi:hypothetical protein